jgi:choline dehydrogenase-like flavoprotein
MLGGSSSINGMLYFHGHPDDYNGWERDGNPGWGWDRVGAAFKKIENHELGAGLARGVGGPVNVSINPNRSALMDRLIEAGRQMGLPVKEDLNEPDQDGIGYTVFNIGRGMRSGSSQAFLHPVIGRPNLTVVTDTLVRRVVFEGRKAVGVECESRGTPQSYTAAREVILSAGALQTPQLLELSGIGAAQHLRSLGIEVLADRPGVGENLREHCLIVMQRRLRRDLSLNKQFSGWRLTKNVLQYALTKGGLMAYPGFDASAFVRTAPGASRPDAHLIASLTSMDLRSWDGWTKGPTLESLPGMQFMGYPTSPRSQGTVHIVSKDPKAAPKIEVNYLTDAYDRHVSVHMFRFMRKLLDSAPLADIVAQETIPGAAVQTDDEILASFTRFGGPGYHACGSARMGNDPMAVVDARLRVHGVDGLRVVDISIFPTQTAGNTNAPALATAWCAADLIIEDQRGR